MLCRVSLIAAAAMVLGGCYSWEPAPLSPRRVVEFERPGVVRAHLASGETLLLLNPIIRGDSVVETGQHCTSGRCVERTDAVLLNDVVSVDQRAFSGAKTFGWTLIGVLGILTVGLLASPPGL